MDSTRRGPGELDPVRPRRKSSVPPFDPLSDKVRRWELTARGGTHRGEKRAYEQTELTIDGEMALFAIGNRALSALQANGFQMDELRKLFPPVPDPVEGESDEAYKARVATSSAAQNWIERMDWRLVTDLLARVAEAAPRLIAEASCVMLGVFPTDEEGDRNPDYPDEVKFMRGAVGLAEFAEMIETLVAQNDAERLRRPFESVWGLIRSLNQSAIPEVGPASSEHSTSSSPTDTEPPDASGGGTPGRRSTRT